MSRFELGNGTFVDLIQDEAQVAAPILVTASAGTERNLGAASGLRLLTAMGAPILEINTDGLFRRQNAGAVAKALALFSLDGRQEHQTSAYEFRLRVDADDVTALSARLRGDNFSGTIDLMPTRLTPTATELSVVTELQFAGEIGPVGVACMQSLFLFSRGVRRGLSDYRTGVHDSDGLWMRSADGQVGWRSLNNPPALANSYLSQRDPSAYGLVQRARNFEDYQDADAHYQARDSVVLEPMDDWGEGFIRLIEAPADTERARNISAFWMPREAYGSGSKAQFRYKLTFSPNDELSETLASVSRLSVGQGGVSGVKNNATLRKFVVDFVGPSLSPSALARGPLDAFVSISPGQISNVSVSRLPQPNTVRLAIDADTSLIEPVECRAYLISGGKQVTESWFFQWRG